MAGEERVTKLKIDNVKKIYQTRKGEMTALNGVNLDIKENEFICVAVSYTHLTLPTIRLV